MEQEERRRQERQENDKGSQGKVDVQRKRGNRRRKKQNYEKRDEEGKKAEAEVGREWERIALKTRSDRITNECIDGFYEVIENRSMEDFESERELLTLIAWRWCLPTIMV